MIFSELFKMQQNRWDPIFHCPPNFVTLHEAQHYVRHAPEDLGRHQLEPDHRVHDRRELKHLDEHVR
jgi:hypothetical protein